MKSIGLYAMFGSLLTLAVFFSQCKKSDNDNPNDPGIKIEYVTATVTGRITDESGLPVSSASVKAGSGAATTDVNGNFRINGVSLNKNAGFVQVDKDGFFQGSRTIILKDGSVNYVTIQLIKKTVSGTVSGNSGGTITVASGGSITFPASSFINTANNAAYTGTVSVSAFFLNPAAANFQNIMPGALRGINTSNQETGLQSYGMMAVELTGASGEKLQLASGKTATITFPIVTGLQASAPATIPLWHFSDTDGIWKEEGSATKQGTSYVGTVSHFSYWNCDYPYAIVDFNATFKDGNGNALYPADVRLKVSGDTINAFGYGKTDSAGFTSGKIPANKALQLGVYNKCGTLLYTSNVGPFSSNADLDTITINSANIGALTISGTVINCNAAAVTSGYVDVTVDNITNRAVINNGSFSIAVGRCNTNSTTAQLTAYDLAALQNGTTTTVTVSTGSANAGQLSACGNTLTDYLSYTINGALTTLTSDDILSAKRSGSTTEVYGYHSNQTSFTDIIFSGAAQTGTVTLDSISVQSQSPVKTWKKSGTMNVNVTEYGDATTGYIAGNFTGSVINGTDIVPFTCTFRIKRKQ